MEELAARFINFIIEYKNDFYFLEMGTYYLNIKGGCFMKNVRVVENGIQAKEVIEQFLNRGYTKDEVYLLAHDKNRSKDLTEALETNDVGVSEQGAFDLVANVFRSRGDELRSKIHSLGLSDVEAQQYERELDQGRVLVIATKAG